MSTLAPDQPRARSVEFSDGELCVHLVDGRTIQVPLEWFPKLRDAPAADLQKWRLIGQGVGIHWEKLDEDISVRGLLMPEAAVATTRKSA